MSRVDDARGRPHPRGIHAKWRLAAQHRGDREGAALSIPLSCALLGACALDRGARGRGTVSCPRLIALSRGADKRKVVYLVGSLAE
jgi:hypothetical protein